jgi:AcrR family transcriptional regulator
VIRTQPGRDQRRDDIRQDLSAAVEGLLNAGAAYSEVSVERLCEEAGISRATFYQYFEGKGDLLSQLAEAILRDLGDTTEFWWHLPPGSQQDALRETFRRTFELYREHRGVMRSLSEVAAHDSAMRERLDSIVGWAIAETAQHIREGIRSGTVNPSLDPDETAEWLCWMFERGLYEIAGSTDERALEPMLTAVTGLIWNALYRNVN